MKIAVDAMGGDYAPQAIVEGVVTALKESEYEYEIILVGQEDKIKKHLGKEFSSNNISIVHADEVVGMHEQPALALRKKKHSSISLATQLVKTGKADALVTAGNTGATAIITLVELGRLTGVGRSAIASVIPTVEGHSILLDVGANVDCKPSFLFQFAIMGNIYAKYIMKKENPKIGLLNIGEESSKGNKQIIAAYKIFKKSRLNFIGNVEGREIISGKVDVIVCDGFVGNIVLKFSEGLSEMLFHFIDQELLKRKFFNEEDIFKNIKEKVDYAEYGGAPLLGVNGVVIISHGNSSPKAIMNALKMAKDFVCYSINQHIVEEIKLYHEEM